MGFNPYNPSLLSWVMLIVTGIIFGMACTGRCCARVTGQVEVD